MFRMRASQPCLLQGRVVILKMSLLLVSYMLSHSHSAWCSLHAILTCTHIVIHTASVSHPPRSVWCRCECAYAVTVCPDCGWGRCMEGNIGAAMGTHSMSTSCTRKMFMDQGRLMSNNFVVDMIHKQLQMNSQCHNIYTNTHCYCCQC